MKLATTIYSRSSSNLRTVRYSPHTVMWAAKATVGSYECEMRSQVRRASTTKLETLSENCRKNASFAHHNQPNPEETEHQVPQ